jgi:hypothetical protein
MAEGAGRDDTTGFVAWWKAFPTSHKSQAKKQTFASANCGRISNEYADQYAKALSMNHKHVRHGQGREDDQKSRRRFSTVARVLNWLGFSSEDFMRNAHLSVFAGGQVRARNILDGDLNLGGDAAPPYRHWAPSPTALKAELLPSFSIPRRSRACGVSREKRGL